jgi:DNA-binding transcriptional MerR regulator
MRGRLKIGDFARLAGVPVKTLRFYADEGVLVPAGSDPQTGYRFYDEGQLGDALRVLNLREAGVSLDDIRGLAGAGAAELAGALTARRAALLKEKARIAAKLKIVDGLLGAVRGRGVDAIRQVRVVSIEPEFVYAVRARVDPASNAVAEMFEAAERAVGRAGARANRSPFTIQRRTADAKSLDVEVCVPVRDDRIDSLETTLIAGAEIACAAAFAGRYARAAAVERRLRAYLAAFGLAADGPLREVYRRFGADEAGYALPQSMLAASPDRYVTELRIAVAAAAPS